MHIRMSRQNTYKAQIHFNIPDNAVAVVIYNTVRPSHSGGTVTPRPSHQELLVDLRVCDFVPVGAARCPLVSATHFEPSASSLFENLLGNAELVSQRSKAEITCLQTRTAGINLYSG